MVEDFFNTYYLFVVNYINNRLRHITLFHQLGIDRVGFVSGREDFCIPLRTKQNDLLVEGRQAVDLNRGSDSGEHIQRDTEEIFDVDREETLVERYRLNVGIHPDDLGFPAFYIDCTVDNLLFRTGKEDV